MKFKPLPLVLNSLVAIAAGTGIYLNAATINGYLPEFLAQFAPVGELVHETPHDRLAGLLALLAGALVPSGIYGWFRRVTTTGRVEIGRYFDMPEYTNLPVGRMGYSDRISYTLSELSDLAYWEVFDERTLEGLEALAGVEDPEKRANIQALALKLLESPKQTTVEKFDAALSRGGFKPITRLIRTDSTQCFVCVHEGFGSADHKPYIVVAFRGSEKEVGDWLTNADAVPAAEFTTGRVHQGFYQSYKSIQGQVLDAVRSARAQYGQETPVFFTGHSLGGALAVVATRLNAPDEIGGCYTYGAPRVGDYAFFKGLKTPMYRIVNASDLVPRVPPGVWSYLLLGLCSLLSFLTARWQPVSDFFERLKGLVDKINDYRHHGDMRFLPDVPSANLDDASRHLRELEVLSNPNQFDMIQWFFRHVLVSFGMPVKSHSMKLYRNKLLRIARNRMQPFDVGETPL